MDNLYGRTILYTSAEHIDRTNVLDVLTKLGAVHDVNATQIDYLYGYYKGEQEILNREKTYNTYICNIITENRAKEIVDFKTAYLAGDAIKYSANDQEQADNVDILNDFCRLEGKESADYDLVEWMNIGGTAYRMILPKTEEVEEFESPFTITTLDPRLTFVAYTAKIPHKPKLACYKTVTDKETTYSVYVKNDDGNKFFEIVENEITKEEVYPLSELPIIEYPKGKSRLGAFEPVISILDAINNLDSNRIDGVEQAIQTLLVLTNCKLPDGYTAESVKEMGLIELVSNEQNKASVDQISTTLDQTQTQALKEDLLQSIRSIVSMPTVSQGSSGGDNGLAVLYRNGWEGAYESAMTDQKNIDQSEYRSIKLMLEICDKVGSVSIPIRYINIDYTRQHYENMATKSQVLIAMLNNDKIHPKVAYEVSGLFYDPNKKYLEGLSWYEEQHEKSTAVEETEEEVTEEPLIEGAEVEEDRDETETTEI